MRVAFISYDYAEYCIRLAGALSSHAEARFWLPEQETLPYRSLLPSAVGLRTFVKPRLRHAFRQVRTTAALVREIRQFDPDVIHLQSGHLWFNCALPFLRRYPLVLTIHDPAPHAGDRGARNTPQWIYDFGSHRAAQVIVHASQLKKLFLDRLRLPETRVHVIPMVLQGDDQAREDVEEADGTVLFFGRIWPYKGLDYLIQAEPLIAEHFPGLKIVIAGTGEDLDRYRRMMVHPERFVLCNEYVSDDKRAELFRQASVVVLPYVEASQSGVIPVAYRYGKPVVATTVGGLPALVDHGTTGLLVPPRDTRALADAILRLLLNKQWRLQLGSNAKRKVDSECSPEAVACQTIAVYQQALCTTNQPITRLTMHSES
jgi:glycosyltransferase involved in cell wall biosynthesis